MPLARMQGRTGLLSEIPPELLLGHYLVIGNGAVSLFMCTVDKVTVQWTLTTKMSEAAAEELATRLNSPAAAQVMLNRGSFTVASHAALLRKLHGEKAKPGFSLACGRRQWLL